MVSHYLAHIENIVWLVNIFSEVMPGLTSTIVSLGLMFIIMVLLVGLV